ncbi:hypothetical protein FHS96_005772 [Sphingomonas zeicaulis]|uniref:hypothetical protein n=1 Tax=Sphingomonas zeicaulis TaxID=1632740 RepID=UPI003D21237B
MPLHIEQRLASERQQLAEISRYAARRERFLEALDWDAMPDSFAFETSMDDEAIDHDLAEGATRIAALEIELASTSIQNLI